MNRILTMRRAAILLASLLLAAPAPAASTANNDTCDIGVTPAATLLLPYFEVDFEHPRGAAAQTLFTVVNASPRTHVANVTLWTDWAYPALSFSIVLHGYGMETIDLHELFARGAMPSCSGPVPAAMLDDLRTLFTTGRTPACTLQVGNVHVHAIGYATIDVVAACTTKNPSMPEYYSAILFDNVLTGDYERIDGNFATGGTLVHIRAIPEGGPAGAVAETNLPYTFYDRFAKKLDRRQPLPSAFAMRFVSGNGVSTSVTVWREAYGDASCASFGPRTPYSSQGPDIAIAERLRFDEHENATTYVGCCCVLCPPELGTAAAFSMPLNDGRLPPPSTYGDAGGWLYLNLHDRDKTRPRQNWVISSMRAGTSYAVDVRAAALGNGCSPAAVPSSYFGTVIGPLP